MKATPRIDLGNVGSDSDEAPIGHFTALDLRSALAANLARARAERGWTLRELASRADVSKALLSKIERSEGNPAMETLFRIASALGCSMSELLAVEVSQLAVVRADEGRVIESEERELVSRLIFAMGPCRRAEIYEFAMIPNVRSEWKGRSDYGVTEFAVVLQGQVRVGVAGNARELGPGDAISFRHGAQNLYESLDEHARMICVVAYDN
jgi:transcriptional regulator with XRE-family HTH domain